MDKPKVERKTLGQLLDALREDFKLRGKGSVKNLNLIARVEQDLEDKWADTFSAEDLRTYVALRRRDGAANSTINHAPQILASAFRLAELPGPKVTKLEEKNVREGFFTREEFDRVCSHLPDDLKDFARFAYLCGWRKNSIATLEWSDVQDGNIHPRGVHSKNRKPYFVPIVGELVEIVARTKKAQAVKTGDGVMLSPLVFHRASGEPIGDIRKAWRSACIKAGVAWSLVPRPAAICGQKSHSLGSQPSRRHADHWTPNVRHVQQV